MPSMADVRDLLQPSINAHASGVTLEPDFLTQALYFSKDGRRAVVATVAEIAEGSYRAKFLDRLKAFAGDKFRS